ncbi:codeine O-demethylase-like [Impatiens glandulifera]|uniref:codeine O-demethylase-like n=1 Tax=Impatiens glandulifera TaxID=253017 RepID=UPI001FB0EA35|nr:codeine O-demethylase-like [Impatiens glandulifera]
MAANSSSSRSNDHLDQTATMINVQELAKNPMTSIPRQFLLPNDHNPAGSTILPHDQTIPVVDMNELQKIIDDDHHDSTEHHLDLDNFFSICKEWGIFQLVNHGLGEVVEKVKEEIEEFYKLPLEEKMKYRVSSNEGNVEGYGQTKATLMQKDDHTIDWADRLYLIINPLHRRNPNLLPLLPPSLRDTLESYFTGLENLGMKLLLLMGRTVGIGEKEMVNMFEDGMRSMRMTYYPPCPQPELVMGLTPHSDGSGLTFLLQVNSVQGLQVNKSGLWLPVTVLPSALVVNIGDVLQIMTNGIYKSIEHRATVNSEKERISLAVFFNPKFEANVGPCKSVVDQSPENQPMFRTIQMENYYKEFFSRRLNGKAFLENMKLINNNQSIV